MANTHTGQLMQERSGNHSILLLLLLLCFVFKQPNLEREHSVKDRNGRDVTEAEDNKKRWQEYTEELYKKDLHNPDNHHGVITHLEPDILECEVKWALGSFTTKKLLDVMEFQLSYFKS